MEEVQDTVLYVTGSLNLFDICLNTHMLNVPYLTPVIYNTTMKRHWVKNMCNFCLYTDTDFIMSFPLLIT